MGVSIDAMSKPDSQYVLAVKQWVCKTYRSMCYPFICVNFNCVCVFFPPIQTIRIANVIVTRMFDFKLRYKLIYQFSKLAQDEAHALSILHGFTDDVIKKRRQELLEHVGESKNVEQDDQIGIRKKRAFLDILLQSTIDGKPLSDLEIREEVCNV